MQSVTGCSVVHAPSSIVLRCKWRMQMKCFRLISCSRVQVYEFMSDELEMLHQRFGGDKHIDVDISAKHPYGFKKVQRILEHFAFVLVVCSLKQVHNCTSACFVLLL